MAWATAMPMRSSRTLSASEKAAGSCLKLWAVALYVVITRISVSLTRGLAFRTNGQ